jgi:hypothetical protein
VRGCCGESTGITTTSALRYATVIASLYMLEFHRNVTSIACSNFGHRIYTSMKSIETSIYTGIRFGLWIEATSGMRNDRERKSGWIASKSNLL